MEESVISFVWGWLQWLICSIVYKVPWVKHNLLLNEPAIDTAYNFKALTSLYHAYRIDQSRKISTGSPAFNAQVWTLEGISCNLLDFAKGSRPLVVNFGSCSWRPFIRELEAYRELVSEFADITDHLMVYIEEAHPTDGWMLNKNIHNIHSHLTLEERFAAARILQTYEIPVVYQECISGQ